jgi:formamidopyrimidine-DNA glycosylase
VPELPEVETVCQGLRPFMVNQTIEEVILRRSDLRYPFPPLMAERLKGQTIYRIDRRAKYILIYVGNYVWIIHLGMSGRLQRLNPSDDLTKHDHVVIHLTEGQRFVYHDPRRFGFMDLCDQAWMSANRHLKNLGIEPLDDHVSAKDLYQKLSSSQRLIKSALLDQTIVVGLGNIYVCESLWLSGISPYRHCSALTIEDWHQLLRHIRQVLRRAILAGGSSLKDHRQVNGHLGYFQHQFSVYDHHGKPCQREGCQGRILKEVINNRSTYYCPQCQY